MKTPYGLGWRRQLPDPRDRVFAAPAPILGALPPYVDLRHSGFYPPLYDQLSTSSCTGQSVGAVVHIDMIRQGLATPRRTPSRLFAYWNARAAEGTEQSDGGAVIRDVVKGIARHGICFEDGPDSWPFDPGKVLNEPPTRCYTAAHKNLALDYRAVAQTSTHLRACIAAGNPVVFGFMVFENMMDDAMKSSGRLPMPGANDVPIGGHACVAVGFNDNAAEGRVFLVRNSWSEEWGPFGGHFLIPYELMLDPQLASDFWMIRTVGPRP